MISEIDIVGSAARFEPAAVLDVAAEFGLAAPGAGDMEAARRLAADLMRHEVVSVETLRSVQRAQATATLVFRERGEITGVSGQLLLRQPAFSQLLAGVFDAVDVETDLLSRAGETPAVGYSWGIAGATRRAAAAVQFFGREVRARLFPALVIFTRAVTPIGRHVATTRHGYKPLRAPDDDLMIRLPEARVA
jgi:hypothetical protein